MPEWTARTLLSPSAATQHLCDRFRRPDRVLDGTSLAAHGWPLPPLIRVEDAVQIVENLLDQHDAAEVIEAYSESFVLSLAPGLEIGAAYAQTIGQAIGHLAQYAGRRTGLDTVQVRRGEGLTFVVLDPPVDLKRMGQLNREIGLARIVALVRRMYPGPPSVMSVELRHAPLRRPEQYADLFRCPVGFRQCADACRFPTEWEGVANPVGDVDLFRFAQSRCERDIAAVEDLDSSAFIRVRIVALIAETGRPPKVKELAHRQACSPRTIMRRLKAAGTNYQDLVDSIQMQRAEELLRTSGASVEMAAERLGYSDASSFRRSFHRWFGVKPGRWRQMG